jgi:hypothetical protein
MRIFLRFSKGLLFLSSICPSPVTFHPDLPGPFRDLLGYVCYQDEMYG